MRYN
jgi:hypothetical protein